MLEDLAQWVERVDQLTYDMEDMVDFFNSFIDVAMIYAFVVGFMVLVIFILVMSAHRAIRRIEQKLNYLIGEDFEDYQINRRDYEIYR